MTLLYPGQHNWQLHVSLWSHAATISTGMFWIQSETLWLIPELQCGVLNE
uniref:Uncharacterized protein n=1 Tax=Anguilla anguilla TaxID=7936 RepID=A0A0E9U884_ANGAN